MTQGLHWEELCGTGEGTPGGRAGEGSEDRPGLMCVGRGQCGEAARRQITEWLLDSFKVSWEVTGGARLGKLYDLVYIFKGSLAGG